MNQIPPISPTSIPSPATDAIASVTGLTGDASEFENLMAQVQAQPAQAAPVQATVPSITPDTASEILALLSASAVSANAKAGAEVTAAAPSESGKTETGADLPSDLAGFAFALQVPQVQLPHQLSDPAALPSTPTQPVDADFQNQAPNSDPKAMQQPVAALPSLQGAGIDPALANLLAVQNQKPAHVAPPAARLHAGQPAAAQSGDPTPSTQPQAGQPASGFDDKAALQATANTSGDPSRQSGTQSQDAAKQVDQSALVQTQSATAAPSFSAALVEARQSSGTPLSAQAVPLDAIAVHIARKSSEGASQFEISLHPAELGKLDITLKLGEDGRVSAILRAERAETLDLLQRDSRALEQQLRQAGLDVGSNALSFQLSHGNSQRQANSSAQSGFRNALGDTPDAATQVSTTYIAVRKRDGLDIKV